MQADGGKLIKRGANLLSVLFPHSCEREVASAAIKQRGADQMLKRGDASTRGTGRDGELDCDLFKRSQPRGGFKGAQGVNGRKSNVGAQHDVNFSSARTYDETRSEY